MNLSSMVVSRDWQEVSLLECILGGLHIGVEVEPELERAHKKLQKAKIDALIVDCDLAGCTRFLQQVQQKKIATSVPLLIASGSASKHHLEDTGASFVFKKPISVEQAVHTLSSARNLIMGGRLRYHRETMNVPANLTCRGKGRTEIRLLNLSRGGIGVWLPGEIFVQGPVRVSFALPGSDASLKVMAELEWTDREGNAGFRFVQMSRKMQRDLQLWLEKQYFRRR